MAEKAQPRMTLDDIFFLLKLITLQLVLIGTVLVLILMEIRRNGRR